MILIKAITVVELASRPSRITNKWMRLGVPLVGCGEGSEVAHGKLQGNFSILKQNLLTLSKKYNTYGLPLLNEWCFVIHVHLEGS